MGTSKNPKRCVTLYRPNTLLLRVNSAFSSVASLDFRFFKNSRFRSIAIICMMIAMLLYFFISCSGGKKEFVDFEFDRETSYNMKTTDVTLLISDSGITKFRLETKEWYVFDEAAEPYYYFPQKVHGEQLDTLLRVEAYFDADTAYYYSQKKLWKLINNVKAVNLEGQLFETSLLYWDNTEGRIYSDQFMRITKGEFINSGIGFEANQTLSEYKIFNATAEIPFEENISTDTITKANTNSF